MIITGIMVMLFLGLHFYDFWLPEIKTKFINGDMTGMLSDGSGYRYFEELTDKFVDPIRVVIYVVAFVFLSLHLMHGFQSSFQSVGFRKKHLDTADSKTIDDLCCCYSSNLCVHSYLSSFSSPLIIFTCQR